MRRHLQIHFPNDDYILCDFFFLRRACTKVWEKAKKCVWSQRQVTITEMPRHVQFRVKRGAFSHFVFVQMRFLFVPDHFHVVFPLLPVVSLGFCAMSRRSMIQNVVAFSVAIPF